MAATSAAQDQTVLIEIVAVLRNMVGRPLRDQSVDFLDWRVGQLAFLDPDLLQVVLAGKFNSGKSSILNALVGVDLAPVDCFRKTRWEARYWRSPQPRCRLHRQDGSSEEVSLGDFLQACDAGDSPVLRDLEYVAIEDPSMLRGIGLIDSPGIGVGDSDDRTAQQALGGADLVLLVIDATHVGDVVDMALGAELLRLQMPVLVALNKCDLLSADEISEVRSYLADQLGVGAGDVIETSALDSTGVAGLRTRLEAARPLASEMRRKAAHAHRQATLELARELIESAQEQYLDFMHRREVLIERIRAVRAVVEQTLAAEVAQLLRVELFDGQRERIAAALAAELAKHPAGMTDEQVLAVLSQVVPRGRPVEQTLQGVAGFAARRASELWGERTAESADLPQLHGIHGTMRSVDLRLAAAGGGDPDDAFATGATVSVAVGATMATYVAALGPLAPFVTAGAAATGVGIPIAAVGILVAWGLRAVKKGQQSHKVEVVVNEMLDRCESAAITAVEQELLPLLEDHHRAMEQRLVAAGTHDLQDDLLPAGDPGALGLALRDAGIALGRLWACHDGTRWSAPLDGHSLAGDSVAPSQP